MLPSICCWTFNERRRRRVGLNKILVLPGVVTLGILEQGRCEGEECIPRCEVRTGDSGVAATVRAYELLYCKRTWGDRRENNSTVCVSFDLFQVINCPNSAAT